MNHSFTILTEKLRGLNTRVFTEADFWQIVKREKIIVRFWPLPNGGKGFYGVNRKRGRVFRYIVVDSKLDDWLPIAFHELIHHFLHVPTGKLQVFYSGREHTRQDRQADMFALIMQLPLPLFLEMADTPFDQTHEFTELIERKKIYDTYGY